MHLLLLSFPIALTALVSVSTAYPTKRANTAAGIIPWPVFGEDFPDPALLEVRGQWYAYATARRDQRVHVQLATSSDYKTWSLQPDHDALPNLPAWVNQKSPKVWSPDVWKMDNGKYMMYFSAMSAKHIVDTSSRTHHCVGHAMSSSPMGPFLPLSDSPLFCPLDQGGAIDPNHFQDADGSHYVAYKVDGNAIGHGGECGNTNAPQVATPIMLQQVAADGFTKIGAPVQILDRDASDGPLVEAPSLARRSDGSYFIFYSSHCWSSGKYDVRFAHATNVRGPYTKAGRLLATGSNGLRSPGGADVSRDGKKILFHGSFGGGRAMFAGDLEKFTSGNFGLRFM